MRGNPWFYFCLADIPHHSAHQSGSTKYPLWSDKTDSHQNSMTGEQRNGPGNKSRLGGIKFDGAFSLLSDLARIYFRRVSNGQWVCWSFCASSPLSLWCPEM